MTTPTETVALALQYHQSGDLPRAVSIYQQVLAADPHNADVWCFLGAAYQALGKLEDAVASYRQAVLGDLSYAEAYNNLANALEEQGHFAAALVSYRQAIALKPDCAEMYYNLAKLLKKQGELEQAIENYQHALQLKADYAEARNNLGNIYFEQGKLAEATASYRAALRLQPNNAEACSNLGRALEEQNELQEAETCYRHAVEQWPQNAGAHAGLGLVLHKLNRLDEALVCLVQAVRLQPERAEAHYNLGIVLQQQGRLTEAMAHYQEARRLKPDYIDAHCTLGDLLQIQGDLVDAAACFQAALRLAPDHSGAHNGLGNILTMQGHLAEGRAEYRKALELEPNYAAGHSNLLFAMNYDPGFTPAQLFAEHQRWAAQHGAAGDELEGLWNVRRMEDRGWRMEDGAEALRSSILDPPSSILHPPSARTPLPRPLRLGYVSPDLRGHAIASFIGPVLAGHDHEQFEVFCYADVLRPDMVTRDLVRHADTWHATAGWSDQQLEERIRADRIDVLVDLAGHTAKNRLRVFAHKPAPVQVTYLGYPNTTGLTAIDYRLTDAVADPPGEPICHSEELVRLPGCFCCHVPVTEMPAARRTEFIPSHAVTFGSLNKLGKLNADVLDLWSELLRILPGSRLLVGHHTLKGETRDRLHRLLSERGIAGDRLDLRCVPITGKGPPGLELYQEIDIALDTFPWSGHATTCDALWMGVPVLTLRGVRHAGRMSASILTAVGLSDWIAESPGQYLALARQFSADRDALIHLRAGMRDRLRASPLCNGPAFTRGLEEAYRKMWERWHRG